jgi:hypothetical protein
MFHISMLTDFTQHTAIATPHNQDAASVTVRQDGRVGEHFMVDKFITLGGLHNAIKGHHSTESGIVKNQ